MSGPDVADDCVCEEPPRVPTIGNPHTPPYRRDAVKLGPFEDEPSGLGHIVRFRDDGVEADARAGEVASNGAAWMVGALETAGVDLGEFDRYVAALLAHDSWSIVQVVAGWVARAHQSSAPAN